MQVLQSIAAEAMYYQAPESNFCNLEADFSPFLPKCITLFYKFILWTIHSMLKAFPFLLNAVVSLMHSVPCGTNGLK